MSSFPFFRIAQNRNLPYERILQIREELVNNPVQLEVLGNDLINSNTVYVTVAKAELAERERRLEIMKNIPEFFPEQFTQLANN